MAVGQFDPREKQSVRAVGARFHHGPPPAFVELGAYKLLGGAISTEISFQLPSVRVEHIRAGKHVLCGLTAVTPINETEIELNHQIYWTQPWLTPLTPLLRPFARAFLKQDRDIVTMQQEGLKHDPQLLLINDADMQAKWYYRLIPRSVDKDPWRSPIRSVG